MLALGMVPSASPCPAKKQAPEGLNTLKGSSGTWKGCFVHVRNQFLGAASKQMSGSPGAQVSSV